MKIITYNVNGIRAAIKKDFILWLEAAKADIICLQEVKALPEQFDVSLFESLGYTFNLFPAEKKGYSGVAILSKVKVKKVFYGCGIKKYDDEGRILKVDLEGFSVISVYMPSGASKEERQVFKLEFLRDFSEYVDGLLNTQKNLIIGGDFNLCHQAIDIHNPYTLDGFPGFTPQERNWMSDFLDKGFVDSFRALNIEPHNYSWWSYRSGARVKNLGWRIDYLLISSALKGRLKSARHLSEAFHSDHCPVMIELI